MIVNRAPQHELQYRPLASKTLRQLLIGFIAREFPRLGGPWIIERFVEARCSASSRPTASPETAPARSDALAGRGRR